MNTNQNIVTVTEHRQVAKTMEFPPDLAPYINWDSIEKIRRELGSDVHVTSHKDGGLTIVLSWSYSEEELQNAVV